MKPSTKQLERFYHTRETMRYNYCQTVTNKQNKTIKDCNSAYKSTIYFTG